jgi:hypothetical protein
MLARQCCSASRPLQQSNTWSVTSACNQHRVRYGMQLQLLIQRGQVASSLLSKSATHASQMSEQLKKLVSSSDWI